MTERAYTQPTVRRPHVPDGRDGTRPILDRRLVLLGGLSGVASTLAYFAGQAVLPWDHDLPAETAQWEIALTLWTTLAIAPFAIALAYAIYRLIAWERDGALNQLGFVFAVVAFSVLAVTQSFQLTVPSVLTAEMQADGSDPEAWDRVYAGLNALDLGTDLAWDLFLGLWMLCVGVAMLRHSRLGARWGVPALALVPPFFALNIATTPDPPHLDLGPVVGFYFFALSVRLVCLGYRARAPLASPSQPSSLKGARDRRATDDAPALLGGATGGGRSPIRRHDPAGTEYGGSPK